MGILLILPLFIIWPVSFVEGERRGEGRGERRGGEGRGGEERRGEERGGRGERGAPRPQHQGHGVTFGPSFIDPLASIFCRRREERRGEERRGEERRGEERRGEERRGEERRGEEGEGRGGEGRGGEERRGGERGERRERGASLGPNISSSSCPSSSFGQYLL